MKKPPAPALVTSSKRQISWPHLLLGLAGLAVSGYAVHVHQIVMAGGQSACGISATINCDAVIGSKYGMLYGLPLGVWGMLYFALLMLTAINDSNTPLRVAVLSRLAATAAGFIAVLGLAYISYRIIGVACPVCMSIHAIVTLLFLYSIYEVWQLRHKNTVQEKMK